IDIEPIAVLDKQTPAYLSGVEHQQARRDIAQFIASRRKEIAAWFGSGLPEYFAPLSRPGRVEVMSEILRPMTLGFLSAFIGLDMRVVDISLVSLLIDNTLRLKQRIEGINQALRLKQYLQEQTGQPLNSPQVNLLTIMALFGKDTLWATFGEC